MRLFDLFVVILYYGNMVEFGYFVAYIRERKSKAWKIYDDERVIFYVVCDEFIFNLF